MTLITKEQNGELKTLEVPDGVVEEVEDES